MDTLISEHVHRRLDVPPATASEALGRLDPRHPLREALAALGLSSVASVQRTEVPAATAAFDLTWALPEGGAARVAWVFSIAPCSHGESMVSASIRAGADSEDAARMLLAGWSLLGRIVESHTTRLLDAVASLAEQLAEGEVEAASTRLGLAA
jgi:hypothetical protein